MNHHAKCYVQVDSATAWATSYGSVGSEGCRICDWIVEIEQDAIASMTAEFKAGQRDMLERCKARTFLHQLFALEDEIREALGRNITKTL